MQPLRIIWVGKTNPRFVAEAVEFYRKRLSVLQPVELVEIRAANHSGREAVKALRTEGEAILKRIGPEETLILLDEKGRQATTREFAGMMERMRDQSGSKTCFVIGGAFGVDTAVRQRANEILALSRLTFPHNLIRVIFLEQLYRAFTLLAGHGYHHE